MRSSSISRVLDSLSSIADPIRAYGAPAPARAYLVTRLARGRDAPVVVICADDDRAADFATDVATLGIAVDSHPIPVTHLPAWEQSPYSPIAPALKTRNARISALARLARAPQGQVFVTTLAASFQATLPPSVLASSSITLTVEQSVGSREELVSRLRAAGYLQVDPVEDPGTFSVRGDIVDVFPPGHARPVRVELFGDAIDRIREFDPQSQRAENNPLEALGSILIPPAREVMINAATMKALRAGLKSFADDAGIPRKVRDPVLESIQEGLHPDHSDFWAPFAYESAATFWDHLPPDSLVVWDDEIECMKLLDEYVEEQRRLATRAPESALLVPGVERLFRCDEASVTALRSRSRLFLDAVSIGVDERPEPEEEPAGEPPRRDAPAAKHRLAVRTNEDFAAQASGSIDALGEKLRTWSADGYRAVLLAHTRSQLDRIEFLFREHGLDPAAAVLRIGDLSGGFRWPSEKLVVLTESEAVGSRKARSTGAGGGRGSKGWSGLQELGDLSVDDHVVHVDHGIGRYRGIKRLELSGAPSDFLLLEYAGGDKLYLPVYRLNVVQKYVGGSDQIGLDRLGGRQFEKTKEKVKDAIKRFAFDLVQLYAQRQLQRGDAFPPPDSSFREFESRFPFDETQDQLKAIDETISDMSSGRVMDRLICGDVGFGKTEVAIRAAFHAVSAGKQVVVLVPTTTLAYQHELSFRERLSAHPVCVESVSRFKTKIDQDRIIVQARSGKVDILIGTHRLLSRDVKLKDLGLVIIDEEHRFGVEHKEKLKTLKLNTHVLTMTATPIPRTLHMALSGLRDISLITTPPVDRLPIHTFVAKHDDELIRKAVTFELSRGGQVFFIHNRVQTIHQVAGKIRDLAPDARVAVGHGQMEEGELEKTMLDFYQKRTNVLVCTTIIEAGLDVPSANTIIIDDADRFGLAQLYQLRGRVGRSERRAYAYLLVADTGTLTGDAKRRLEVIQRFVELGSGFSVASHDLEIRGGGNLLGSQQSGHVAAVGFDLYTQLLEEAIQEIRGLPAAPESTRREPEIKAPFAAFLDEKYVPDVHQRLSLYRRFSAAESPRDVDALEEELRDRFGSLPEEAENLLWIIRIKQLLKRAGIEALTVGAGKVSVVTGKDTTLDPAKVIGLVAGQPRKYQLTPDSKLVVALPCPRVKDLFFGVESLVHQLERAAD